MGAVSEPSYADVAQWLPTDIREAIEASLPCPVSGDHWWSHQRVDLQKWGQLEPVAVIEHWRCQCGLVRTTKP